MKKILWFLLSSALLTFGFAQENPYKGDQPLQSVTLKGIPCKAGKPMNKEVLLKVMEFDAKAQVTRYVDYEQEAIVELKANSGSKILYMLPQTIEDYTKASDYKYDDAGNLIEISSLIPDVGKSAIQHTYNSKNQRIASSGFSGNGDLRYTSSYSYGDNDSLVTMETKTPKGVLKHRLEYTYDANNQLIKETKMGKDDRFIYHYAYEYDAAGRKTAIISMGAQGNLISRKSFVFDEAGQFISEKYTFYFEGKEGYSTQTDFKYDKQGRKAEEVYFDRTGKRHSKYVHSYDKEDNLEKTVFLDAKGNVWETVEYTYLKDGSPLTKSVYNGKKQLVDVYKYEYVFREE